MPRIFDNIDQRDAGRFVCWLLQSARLEAACPRLRYLEWWPRSLSPWSLSLDFANLFEYQTTAVKIAAHHLNKCGGVLIGDVVGLGKTLMETTLARIFEDDYHLETLIICPRNLVCMWVRPE